MSRVKKKGGLLAVAASLACVPVPAQATMGCWNERQVAAAQVRDLQSRLMVATMRCRALGINITYAYNRFVIANRTTLQGANGVLRGQFRSGYGIDGERHYDRFATALANTYGGDETDPWICAETEDVAFEAASAQGDVGLLLQLADRLGPPPRLPGGRCGVSFDTAEVEPVRVRGFTQGEPVAAPPAVVESVDATTVVRDRLDDVDEIPAPSPGTGAADAPDEAPAPLPAKPAAKVQTADDI